MAAAGGVLHAPGHGGRATAGSVDPASGYSGTATAGSVDHASGHGGILATASITQASAHSSKETRCVRGATVKPPSGNRRSCSSHPGDMVAAEARNHVGREPPVGYLRLDAEGAAALYPHFERSVVCCSDEIRAGRGGAARTRIPSQH